MSGLGLRWAEFILSCCLDGGLVLEVFHPNIPPPFWSYWLLELSCFSFLCELFPNGSLRCWSRVWSWHVFNVTSAVGAGRHRAESHGFVRGAAFLAQHQPQASRSPYNTEKRKSISDI